MDLLIDSNLDVLLDSIRPRTVFNCVAYGAYSFETDSQLIYRTNFQFITRLLSRLEARVDRLLRPCGQLLGVRRQGGWAAGAGPDRSQQRLRRVQGRRGQPDLLLRQAKAFPVREPAPLLGFRPARRLVPADSQPDPPRTGGGLPRFRQSGRLARFRLCGRRDRGIRRHCAEPDLGRLRRVVQHRHGPQDHDRRGRRDGPQALRHRRRSRPSRCPSERGTFRTGTPTSRRPASTWAGSRARRSRRASRRPSTGTRRCPTRRATSSRPRSTVWTPSTASARSSPATRTTWRFRSCTSGSRPHSPS